jgi:hypothetical protein
MDWVGNVGISRVGCERETIYSGELAGMKSTVQVTQQERRHFLSSNHIFEYLLSGTFLPELGYFSRRAGIMAYNNVEFEDGTCTQERKEIVENVPFTSVPCCIHRHTWNLV